MTQLTLADKWRVVRHTCATSKTRCTMAWRPCLFTVPALEGCWAITCISCAYNKTRTTILAQIWHAQTPMSQAFTNIPSWIQSGHLVFHLWRKNRSKTSLSSYANMMCIVMQRSVVRWRRKIWCEVNAMYLDRYDSCWERSISIFLTQHRHTIFYRQRIGPNCSGLHQVLLTRVEVRSIL